MISVYFESALKINSRKYVIAELLRLTERVGDFSHIIVSGTSGAIVAPTICDLADKQLGVIRKTRENSHAQTLVEIDASELTSYIIIDDLMDRGTTVNYILMHMNDYGYADKCKAILLYNVFSHNSHIKETSYRDIPLYQFEVDGTEIKRRNYE